MQTNFEKKIKEKLHDFRLEPPTHVWKDISASLEEPKRRRVIVWFIFAGSIAFIGIISGSIWMKAHHSVLYAKYNIAEKKLGRNLQTNSTVNAANSLNDHLSQKNILLQENNSTQKKSSTSDVFEIMDQKEKSADKSLNALQDQNNISKILTLKKNASSFTEIATENPIVTDKTFLPKNNNVLSALKSSLFLMNNGAENKTDLNKIAATDLQKNNVTAQKTSTPWSVKKTKRSVWSFLFGGGSTNTVDRNLFLRKSKPLIYTNSSGASDTVKSMRPAYIGFHATGGVQYSFAFNKHWTLFTGLQYSFLLNHQRTGINVNQTSEISNAADTLNKSQQYYKIFSHFINGIIDVNTNTASWLEAPVSFGYKINPRSKVTVELRAGASFTHMFADKWLIPDGRYDKFYYSNELTNNYIVCAHEDIVLTLPKHKLVGLQFQHSITSLGKNAVQPAVFWSNMSLYTTIPLK